MAIDQAEIARLRASGIIVSVAQGYTTLEERTPGDFWGQCPLHGGDNTPSFHVLREECKYKCFGCDAGGDVFDLVMEVEGLTFPQAVEKLGGLNGTYKPDAAVLERARQRSAKRQESALVTGEALPPNTKTLTERGHDMEFLREAFGVRPGREEWCGEYWEYPTFLPDGSLGRTRRKFRDKSAARGMKYFYLKKDERPEPPGYPLQKFVDASEDELREVWMVNGEPSVWLCWQQEVSAVCSLSETSRRRLPELMAVMWDAGVQSLHILLDNDDAGRAGTIHATQAAIEAGFTLWAAEDGRKIPDGLRVVVPHVWTPSAQYPKGYDIADLFLEPTTKVLFASLHQVPRASRALFAPVEEEVPEPIIVASEAVDMTYVETEPPPEHDNVISANFETREIDEKRGRGRSRKEEAVVDGNVVRKAEPIEKKEGKIWIKGADKSASTDDQIRLLNFWLKDCTLVCSTDGLGYIVVAESKRQITMEIGSKEFDQYLLVLAKRHGYIVKRAALTQVQDSIGALARQVRPRRDVVSRIGSAMVEDEDGALEHRVYLDLGDDERHVTMVTAKGWKTLSGDELINVPVLFKRSSGTRALPIPERIAEDERMAAWERFKQVLYPRSDENWVKMVAWILQCLRGPDTAYMGICIHGKGGSGKTTRSEILRENIDPNIIQLVAPPENEREFISKVCNSFVFGVTNITKISQEFSDNLCRLATEGQFSLRELYTTTDERQIKALRPFILNGLHDPVTKHDLRRRCLFVHIPPFGTDDPGEQVSVVKAKFNKIRAATLGLFLDAAVAAMAGQDDPEIRAMNWGSSIDFGCFVAAAEKAGMLPWETGVFRNVYAEGLRESAEVLIERSPLCNALIAFMDDLEFCQEVDEDMTVTYFADQLRTKLKSIAAWQMMDRDKILNSMWTSRVGYQNMPGPLFNTADRQELLNAPILQIRHRMAEDARAHHEEEALRAFAKTYWPKDAAAMSRALEDVSGQMEEVGIAIRRANKSNGSPWVISRFTSPMADDSIFDFEE